MKVLVCGGRNFKDYSMLTRILDRITITSIINGGARGADRLSTAYANDHNIPRTVVRAEWERLGTRAGPLRNWKMLEYQPDLVVAFPGGIGTRHMVRIAIDNGYPVWKINNNGQIVDEE